VHSGEIALAELGRFIDGKMDGAVAWRALSSGKPIRCLAMARPRPLAPDAVVINAKMDPLLLNGGTVVKTLSAAFLADFERAWRKREGRCRIVWRVSTRRCSSANQAGRRGTMPTGDGVRVGSNALRSSNHSTTDLLRRVFREIRIV
jgi:hypothetical protein